MERRFEDFFIESDPQRQVIQTQIEKLQDVLLELFTIFEKKTGLVLGTVYIERLDTSQFGEPESTLLNRVLVAAHINSASLFAASRTIVPPFTGEVDK